MTERTCGTCTLCCKLERIGEADKPGNVWCKHCDIGKGCKIYNERYQACRAFNCLWLTETDLAEWQRPDKVHLYAVENGDTIKVVVEQDHNLIWGHGGHQVIEFFVERGRHVLVMQGNQITFFCGKDQPAPEKLLIDWTLSL